MCFQIKFSSGDVESIAMFEGIKAKDILNSLALEGKKGYLVRESDRVRLYPIHPIVQGETYVLVEKRPKDEEWMKKQSRMPSASLLAKSMNQIVKYLGGSDPVYDVGRVSGIIPLPLAHEAFALYAELFRSHVPTPADWEHVTNFLDMSEFFESQKQRHTLFFEHLTRYLKVACPNLRFVFRSANVEEVDIVVVVQVRSSSGAWTDVVVAKVELRNEVGFAGEPCIEAVKYYGDYINENVCSEKRTDEKVDYKRWSYYSSCVPMLIVEVVGPNIRVGGAICHERPGYEPLTPYLHLLKYVQSSDQRDQVARALSAIPRTVQALADYYQKLWSESLEVETVTSRVAAVTWPFYLRTEKANDPGLEVTKFSRRLDRTTLRQMFKGRDEQLLYLVKYSNGSSEVVKFCQRYGELVHRKWQEAGVAPQFNVTSLSGGWKIIRMEVYSPDDGWLPLNRLDPKAPENATDGSALEPALWIKCKQAVIKAYEQVHGLYPSHVHGDLRKSNILYNQHTEAVVFVDFDWAGLENEATYPPFLNPHIGWPRGVQSGGPMLSCHDKELLLLDLDRKPDLLFG